MCYTKKASIIGFSTGVISSLLLIAFGNKEYYKENILVGILFIFVSLMQYIDYLIWSDIECKNGNNALAGKLGYILNATQPIFILLLLFIRDYKYKNLIILLNSLYILYILYNYSKYIKKSTCSKIILGRPKWSWGEIFEKNNINLLYGIILAINILFLVRNKLEIMAIILVIGMYIISKINYKYHVGEFWCYFVNATPILLLFYQKLYL
jgi:hypothetical protein